MWVILWVTVAEIAAAWAYLEIMYRDAYWCTSIPYSDGSMEIQCYYIP
jgi:hypothetical protein